MSNPNLGERNTVTRETRLEELLLLRKTESISFNNENNCQPPPPLMCEFVETKEPANWTASVFRTPEVNYNYFDRSEYNEIRSEGNGEYYETFTSGGGNYIAGATGEYDWNVGIPLNSNNEVEITKQVSLHQLYQANRVFYMLRNDSIAGLLVGDLNEKGCFDIYLDYVVPKYRDYKLGTYYFKTNQQFLQKRGVRVLKAVANHYMHRNYLIKMGFIADERKDLHFSKRLQV